MRAVRAASEPPGSRRSVRVGSLGAKRGGPGTNPTPALPARKPPLPQRSERSVRRGGVPDVSVAARHRRATHVSFADASTQPCTPGHHTEEQATEEEEGGWDTPPAGKLNSRSLEAAFAATDPLATVDAPPPTRRVKHSPTETENSPSTLAEQGCVSSGAQMAAARRASSAGASTSAASSGSSANASNNFVPSGRSHGVAPRGRGRGSFTRARASGAGSTTAVVGGAVKKGTKGRKRSGVVVSAAVTERPSFRRNQRDAGHGTVELQTRPRSAPRNLTGHALLNHLNNTLQCAKLEARGSSGDRLAVGMLIASLGTLPLLTREQECGLAAMVQAGAAAREARLAAEEASKAEGRAVAASGPCQVEADGAAAKRLLVQFNIRLVISIAKRYDGKGVPLADLIPEGIFGLGVAADKFDPDRGFKFSTYAHWWVRQAVSRSITNQSRVVRLPVHVYDCVARIQRAADELSADPARAPDAAPTAEELGRALGLAPSKVHAYMRAARAPRSLEAPAAAGSNARMEPGALLLETVAEDDSMGLAARMDALETAEAVAADVSALLATLPPRERNVLRLRYGLHGRAGAAEGAAAAGDGGARALTLSEVGAAYGLTREKVRQIEARALRKLRRPAALALASAHRELRGDA